MRNLIPSLLLLVAIASPARALLTDQEPSNDTIATAYSDFRVFSIVAPGTPRVGIPLTQAARASVSPSTIRREPDSRASCSRQSP